jgi:subtilisin family serine protease
MLGGTDVGLKTKVVAYYIDDRERAEAERLLDAAIFTDSFAVGEIDQQSIPELRSRGLIVQEQPEPAAKAVPPPAPAPGVRSFGEGAAASLGLGSEDAVPKPIDYYLLRLNGPLLEPWRDELAALGVQPIASTGANVYKVKLDSAAVAKLQALPFVAGVSWISPESAAPAGATPAAAGAGGAADIDANVLTLDVRLHEAAGMPAVTQWLQAHNVTIVGSSERKVRVSVLENAPEIDLLQGLTEVDVVREYVPPKLYNDAARRILGIDAQNASSVSTLLTQDGSGEIVAIADTGIDDLHPDFQGRIVTKIARGRSGDTSDPNGHGTHVAGSVLGDGTASGGKIKGVAPKAQLVFQSLLDASGGLGGLPVDLNDLFAQAYEAGARIHNDSWGADLGSIYSFESEEVDEFVCSHPDMLIVIAAGNAGHATGLGRAAKGYVDWLSIGSPASCKNALTVGASRSDRTDGALGSKTWGHVWSSYFADPPIADESISGDANALAAFSSRGPCDDQRIKPDVVAPGTDILSTKSSTAPLRNFWGPYPSASTSPPDPNYAFDGGTSMATPLVTGCAVLVRQYYVQDRSHAPSAALLKATLINSTTWLTAGDAVAPAEGTPNYHQGHGRVNMQLAIPNATQPGLALQFVDDWQDAAAAFTRTGERRRYQFILPDGVPELRVCMAYSDAPANGLQNNLNLIVQDQTGKKWLGNQDVPNSLMIPDPANNVESVRIPDPGAGTYFIQVFVGNMLKPPQSFALVVTAVGLPPLDTF